MGGKKLDVEAHLGEMQEHAGGLDKVGKKLASATSGFVVDGNPSGGVGAQVGQAVNGNYSQLDGAENRTKLLDGDTGKQVLNGFGELIAFTGEVGNNVTDLRGFVKSMADGISTYGAVVQSAHDMYLKSDKDSADKLGLVDLKSKDDGKVETEIDNRTHADKNVSNTPSPGHG